MAFILKGTDANGRVVYYTGKAGESQFNPLPKRGQIFQRDDGHAILKRDALNAVKARHGYTFEVVPA